MPRKRRFCEIRPKIHQRRSNQSMSTALPSNPSKQEFQSTKDFDQKARLWLKLVAKVTGQTQAILLAGKSLLVAGTSTKH
ncbi:hypothetical protein MUK42_36047 [Musa troglodytarum]|uniref:Uncharacterized protein n=1 Tax=Musa troglodytarum TaxID=320322 RepID=A0A9E7J9C1_9LILI|nr:hypothetical protein MUK42_36047 [Musa troglodytarum]